MIRQSDDIHTCKTKMWNCSECKDDFCMAETPKFCPNCGKAAGQVKPMKPLDFSKGERGKFMK